MLTGYGCALVTISGVVADYEDTQRISLEETAMSGIESVILEALDFEAADAFCAASGDAHVGVCAAESLASGFRGVVLSRVVPQPSTVDLLIAALDQGATPLKRATKSFSGYGGALSGPADGI